MSIHYIIAWTGGYEAPSYGYKSTMREAMGLAEEWASQLQDGDTIDVLEVDTDAGTVTRVEAERPTGGDYTAPVTLSRQEFGDVDQGPTHGIRVVVPFSEGDDLVDEVAASVWAYYTRNYEDDWQTYRVESATTTVATILLFTYWGDHHLSQVPGLPHTSPR